MTAAAASAATPSTTATPSLLGIYLRLTCVPMLWGGTFIAGRVISAHLPPATAGFVRFVFATLALLAALHFTEGLRALTTLTRRQLLGTMALGATGILMYNLLFFTALSVLPAGRTSLIIALNPVVTLLLAAALMGERMSPVRWLGVALALLGVWVVVTRGDLSQIAQSVGKGELAMFGAVCAWAVYTLLGRKLLQGLSPVLATLWAAIWGTLFLGLLALRDISQVHAASFTLEVWAGLVFLGVLGTAVAFVWYYEGIRQLGAARTVVFNNLVPIFGVLLGWLILGEPLTVSLLAGGGLAIFGVFLVNRVK
ncbi:MULTISPECIES: DMT family transporter [unclassified Polaromonas]|uniref:DMT family transporter n=1 Tax=unclassified Polaromonas TaxID=2638319 RepID=UPI0013DDB2E9|nr:MULTISPECIES: DMT family transporter [unclassified Polaromonas]